MTQQLEVLALPFVACLILTGIHVYLGIHVLSRKVIFVDIALAQIAALGATVGFLLGHDPRSERGYWFSLAFAVLAAGVFALTRTRVERVPQEAVIGLTYAIAAAAAILLADISPHGAEHLKDLLAGSIVWVTPAQILKTGVLYAIIGGFHFLLRRRFLLISLEPEKAFAEGMNVRFWDFLFYLSFGVVITSSVQIAGVLLVFCYLVAPAVFAVMFTEGLRARLALGWGVGAIVSAVGLFFSYDRPSGPMIMVCFAIALIAGAIARAIHLAANRPRAAGLAAASILSIAFTAWGVIELTAPSSPDHLHGGGSDHFEEAVAERAGSHDLGESLPDLRLGLSDSHSAVRSKAILELAARRDPESVDPIIALLSDESTAVRENAAKGLGEMGDRRAAEALLAAARAADEDEWVVLHAATSAARLGRPEALEILIEIARDADAKLARRAAVRPLAEVSGLEGGEGPGGRVDDLKGEGREDRRALERISAWWEVNGTNLTWDVEAGVYRPAIAAAGPAR